MSFSLIVTFFLMLLVIIPAIQNSMALDFKFFIWTFQQSITAMIFYFSLIGGAVVAVMALPKLAKKSLQVKSMGKDIHKLEENFWSLKRDRLVDSR